MTTMRCSVSGIQSKESKSRIKHALDKVNGVQEVGVNLTTGTVQVSYAEPATEKQIKSCIESSGFKVVYE